MLIEINIKFAADTDENIVCSNNENENQNKILTLFTDRRYIYAYLMIERLYCYFGEISRNTRG